MKQIFGKKMNVCFLEIQGEKNKYNTFVLVDQGMKYERRICATKRIAAVFSTFLFDTLSIETNDILIS